MTRARRFLAIATFAAAAAIGGLVGSASALADPEPEPSPVPAPVPLQCVQIGGFPTSQQICNGGMQDLPPPDTPETWPPQ
jgi:hypothetical protein